MTLFWAPDTNDVAVVVRDHSTNDRLELLVGQEANPVDLYEHPYAAWRGNDYRTSEQRDVCLT